MMKFSIPLALTAALAVAACDNNIPPTKAPVDQNPQVDKNPVPKSTTGGDATGTVTTVRTMAGAAWEGMDGAGQAGIRSAAQQR
ncbi:hypothetical protein OHD62_20650 [Mesorhizobium sp. YC-39]|uniref:hypothetical protein n=1 Tax=unclassified Mesorhizobium TaxID=325217 RepID=UPI0021E81A06|nr:MULTISPECIES: hypothetical protein [unclassified Mesorhizobium]MCV3210254.1 hypothetical protein [Mesorhizobium sp. YC-2]MCV3230784.1 hypothetical protein [Mesorhizobium sp. YC-39]